jgi:hypothetical protein
MTTMKATLRIGGGATNKVMMMTGDKHHPFIELKG